jgi:hypothetical protein
MVANMNSKQLNVNLQNNEITEWIPNDQEKSTSVVLYLNLSENKLKSFKLKNIKMKNLSIANNEVEEFIGDFTSIDIRNNKIKELKINKNSSSVLASNNHILEVFYSSEKNSEMLNFDMSHNNLRPSEDFRNFLRKLTKVSSVDISHNSLEIFALDIFDEMENLVDLNLGNTGMTEVKFGSFSNLQEIQFLNLSANNLKELDFHVFSSCKNLTVLDLGGNFLTEINEHEKMREVLPNIESIGLEGKRKFLN